MKEQCCLVRDDRRGRSVTVLSGDKTLSVRYFFSETPNPYLAYVGLTCLDYIHAIAYAYNRRGLHVQILIVLIFHTKDHRRIFQFNHQKSQNRQTQNSHFISLMPFSQSSYSLHLTFCDQCWSCLACPLGFHF